MVRFAVLLLIVLFAVPAQAGPLGLFGRRAAPQCSGPNCCPAASAAAPAADPTDVAAATPQVDARADAFVAQATAKAKAMKARGATKAQVRRQLLQDLQQQDVKGLDWITLIEKILAILTQLFGNKT